MVTHPTDDLAAYSIGALDPYDAAKIASHLRSCDTCRGEVEGYEQAAWRLAEAVAQDAPARMRASVIARAESERPTPERSTRRGLFASIADLFRRPVPAFVPAALVVILIVAFAGYVGARRDADRYASALAGVQNARITALAPSAERPGVRGALVQPANGGAPYLLLDVPSAPSGKTWQAWVIRGDQRPLPAGLSGDLGVIILTVEVRAGDVVAVTLESTGGASAPTSTPVLTGKTS